MKKLIRIENLNAFALRALAILCALAIVSVARAPMAAAQANWAQTYYNGAHTGYNPSETALGVGNVSSLQLLWAASVAGGVTNFAVDGGVVYATGQSNNLVALNASTGARLWTTNTGGNTGINAIAVGGGLVFAQCSFKDTGGTPYGAICAYQASTGKAKWRFSNPCNCLPEASIQSPLVLANGVLYFGYSGGGSGGFHGIYAVKANTGAVLWSYGDFSNGFGSGPAAVAGSSVYFGGGESNQIVALSTSNGALQWATPVNTGDDPVAVSGGVVYAASYWTGSEATLYALNATTGATLWSYTYTTGGWCGGTDASSPPAIAKGVVYFKGIDGALYALRARDGALLWVDSSCLHVVSSPSIANGVVYVNGGDDAGFASNTTAYNAATGALLWSSPSPHGTLEMPPVVVNGILYFASPGDSVCKSICAYSVPANVQNK